MPPLPQRLNALRRRLRRLILVHSMCLLTVGALGILLLLGGLDYLVRFQDRGLRVLASLGFFAALMGFAYRYLYLPGKVRFRDEDLAFRLQHHFPVLDDRLSSAVEFMRQEEEDPAAGSPVLRRAVIAETTAQTETLDFQSVLDARPSRRAAVLAGTIVALAAAVFAGNPPVARTAVARLLNPFNRTVFPQTYHLAVRNPVERLARGGQFEIEIVDAGRRPLPREIRVFYRWDTAEGGQEEETTLLRPASESVVVRRENVLRPFAYRLEGGDDRSMPWHEVAVVEPPAVAALSVRLIPPPYTGWPAARSSGDIRALEGTRLEIAGQANKPLRLAQLIWEDERRYAARLTSDGRGFAVSSPDLTVSESGEYHFDLEDTEGISGGENDHWKIHAVADTAPTVTFEQPAANLYVTPQAVVPLRLQAKDDLALRDVALIYSVGGQGSGVRGQRSEAGTQYTLLNTQHSDASQHSDPLPKGEASGDGRRIPLYAGPEKVPLQSESSLGGGGESRIIEYRWELEPLGLHPGMQVEFAAVAADYRPQTGRSDPRKLSIITPQEFQDRLTARQNLLLGELERVRKMQQAVRGQIEAVQIRWEAAPHIEPAAVDQLRVAELSQRQVTLMLTPGGEGIHRQIENLLADLEANRLEIPLWKQRLEELSADLKRLEREVLPVITRELTAALKTGEIALTDPPGANVPAACRSLKAVEKAQFQVMTALEAWITRLSQWESSQRFQRELIQLQRDQEETARRTSAIGGRTLARELRDLPPPEVTELRILAARQGEHARVLERLLQEMEQSLTDLRQKDPAAAENVADAVEQAHSQNTSGRMRSCGEFLRQNQIGRAAESQKEIVSQLQKLLEILSRRRAEELEVLRKKLRAAAADAAELERRQTELHVAMVQNTESPDPAPWKSLAEAQERLRREADELARRLEVLRAKPAAQSAAEAATAMQQAERSAAAGQGQNACGQADAARKALAETRRQLDQCEREKELELAREQLARLEDAVKHLQQQQQKTLEETRRFEELRQAQGEFTRSQSAGLLDLARVQGILENDARQLAEDLKKADAFAYTLGKAAESMAQAAAGLNRRQSGPLTQQAEQAALDRLALLVEAVRPEPPENQEGSSGRGGAGSKPSGRAPCQGFAPLAELKLLRALQQELNHRTAELHLALDPQAPPAEAQRRVLDELVREQGRLAEMVFQLLPPPAEGPEENQENSPDNADQMWRGPPEEEKTSAGQGGVGAEDEGLQERLRRELGAAAEKEDEQPLLNIARRMLRVERQMTQAKTGPAIQAEQQQIVEELDRVIQEVKRSCQACSAGSKLSQSPKRTAPGPTPSKPGSRPAGQSGPRTGGEKPANRPNRDDIRAALQEHWGELPPHVREQMLQSATEEFMPKYQELLEQYYRRLAEEEKP